MDPQNFSEIHSHNLVEVISPSTIVSNLAYNFNGVTKKTLSFNNGERYVDEQFKLKQPKGFTNIKLKRLSSLMVPGSPLFIDLKTSALQSKITKKQKNQSKPSFLSEINMLPMEHYAKIIEPSFVNEKGFYTVSVVKDGVIQKQIIDDVFLYNEEQDKLFSEFQVQPHPWVHIIVKVWAKMNKGYENIASAPPFLFIKTFSFPDWEIINPHVEPKQNLIKYLSKCNKSEYFIVAQTKSNPNVKLFGFSQKNAGFRINGHYQQYGDIFIKIISHTYDKWNGLTSSEETPQPQQKPLMEDKQFLMPLNEFLNVFHLIYCTINKYTNYKSSDESADVKSKQFTKMSSINSELNSLRRISQINYNKYTLNVDARETNAIVLALDVESNEEKVVKVGLSIYLPEIKAFELIRKQQQPNTLTSGTQRKSVVPWCKLLIAKTHDSHLEASYMESVKEMMLDYGQDLLAFATYANQHDFVAGQFFKGHCSELVHSLDLRTGKYLMRIKIQQKISEYRCFVNTTAVNGTAKIYDPKLDRKEQLLLLEDSLFRKAAHDKKFVTFINIAKKGSWICCRNEYESLGYCYIAVHVVKNADNKIKVQLSPRILKQNGYKIKGHKDFKDYHIVVDAEQNTLIIIKHDKEWRGQNRKWPPQGINFSKIPRH